MIVDRMSESIGQPFGMPLAGGGEDYATEEDFAGFLDSETPFSSHGTASQKEAYAAALSQQVVAHTPPAFTPSSYGNALQKRARTHEARSRSSSSVSEADLARPRSASDAERKAPPLYEEVRDGSESSSSTSTHSGSRPVPVPSERRHRAASIDLLAELDLDDVIADWGAPRRPPPSAEVLSSAHDDQLMGFDMEMPFFCFQGGHTDYGRYEPPAPTPRAAARRPLVVVASSKKPGARPSLGSSCESASGDSSRRDERRPLTKYDDEPRRPLSKYDDEPRRPLSRYEGFGGKVAPPGGRCPAAARAAHQSSSRWQPYGGEAAPAADAAQAACPGGSQYDGKVSSTISVPPAAADLVAGPAPAYESLINFPRAKTRAQIHCVMCGRHPKPDDAADGAASGDDLPGAARDDDPARAVVVIPRQNKDVCRECDKALWRHLETNTHFKWCKGCKRFRNLTAFAEKLAASKCDRCRERGRQGYMRRKGGAGANDDAPPRHDDDA
mmetsp:Transcript_12258/g.38996  ORF Transcript_12258/g.38996 Transcript_12258/m.38996 type:complete len:499 (-) Transcript_12258:624-2120(-)